MPKYLCTGCSKGKGGRRCEAGKNVPISHRSVHAVTWSLAVPKKCPGALVEEAIKELRQPVSRTGLPRWLNGKDPPASARDTGDEGLIPGVGRSTGEEMATKSSILACKIPWIEDPGGPQSIGSQKSQT